MGDVYSVKCKCGYKPKDDIYFGYGFSGVGMFPAFCRECSEMFTCKTGEIINCPYCNKTAVWYDKKQLIKEEMVTNPGDDVVEKFRLTVTANENQKYFCPKCHCFSLELKEDGDWN